MIQRISNCLLEKRAQVLALIARKYVQGIVYNSGDKKKADESRGKSLHEYCRNMLAFKDYKNDGTGDDNEGVRFFSSVMQLSPKAQAK